MMAQVQERSILIEGYESKSMRQQRKKFSNQIEMTKGTSPPKEAAGSQLRRWAVMKIAMHQR